MQLEYSVAFSPSITLSPSSPFSDLRGEVFSLLYLIMFILAAFLVLIPAHFSNLSEILCDITLSSAALATPPNLPSSANLINVQFSPSSTSLIKMLNNTEPTTDYVFEADRKLQ